MDGPERLLTILARAGATEVFRIKRDGETRIGQILQREGQKQPVIVHAAIVVNDKSKGRDPAREIAVQLVALRLEHAVRELIRLSKRKRPVIVEPKIPAKLHEVAVRNDRISVQVSVPDIEFDVAIHEKVEARINFGEP